MKAEICNFITKRDVLKGNLPIYHIHRTIDENGQSFADGSHIIYVNNNIQDETPLGRLMHDFSCTNPNDMHYKELADKVSYLKQGQEGLKTISDVLEKFAAERAREAAEKATEKATKKAKVEFAKNLLSENESVERTARLTKLSLNEVRKLAEKLSA